jgi:mitogen-activated protein kinase kinase
MYMNQADSLGSMSIIELMHQIVREPAPRLGPEFEEEAQEFVDACLAKDPDERHGPKILLVCIPLSSSLGLGSLLG